MPNIPLELRYGNNGFSRPYLSNSNNSYPQAAAERIEVHVTCRAATCGRTLPRAHRLYS